MMTTRRSRLFLERALLEGSEGLSTAENLRLSRWAESDSAFLERYPSFDTLNRAASPKLRRSRVRSFASAVIAAAAVVLAVVTLPSWLGPHGGTRLKGGSSVELWVQTDGQPVRFSGQRLTEGDTLVFRYTTSKPYMALFSVEASGKSNVYDIGPIETGQNRVIPHGVKLDDYLGPERVFFLLSDAPLDEATLSHALKSHLSGLEHDMRGLDLGPIAADVEQVSWLIEKKEALR